MLFIKEYGFNNLKNRIPVLIIQTDLIFETIFPPGRSISGSNTSSCDLISCVPPTLHEINKTQSLIF